MGERDFPAVRTADEPTMLAAMLDWYRAGVVNKLEGLSEADAARRIVGSNTTIGGLVFHLALVEDSWFAERFAGGVIGEPWAGVDWDVDRDWEFDNAHRYTVAEITRQYIDACERSRRCIVGGSLDDLAAHTERPFTLRWALVHLVEETARHLGHLDILREMIDGTTGE